MSADTFTLLQLGNPNLRLISEPVNDVLNPETQTFFDDLLNFVDAVGGMGIAASQVNVQKRVFIMSSKPNQRYPYATEMKPTVIINPEILAHSSEKEKDWEGRLSVPGVRALVPRYTSVSVCYQDRLGHTVEKTYNGFLARVFQHELDHLDGKVFLDRVENNRDIVMEQEWQKLIAKRET
jgi:peptide deformylase